MDRGAWWAMVHMVPKSQTRLSDFHFTSLHVYTWDFPGDSDGKDSAAVRETWF